MNASAATIQIHINGDVRLLRTDQSLSDLIRSLGLPPETALVEHNGQALLRSEWPERRLAEGDRLEILRVVAGG